jgi:hypothetical protein
MPDAMAIGATWKPERPEKSGEHMEMNYTGWV